MGMDIYAGTLTRYYAQNWKTAAQQFAEENGWGYQRIIRNILQNLWQNTLFQSSGGLFGFRKNTRFSF